MFFLLILYYLWLEHRCHLQAVCGPQVLADSSWRQVGKVLHHMLCKFCILHFFCNIILGGHWLKIITQDATHGIPIHLTLVTKDCFHIWQPYQQAGWLFSPEITSLSMCRMVVGEVKRCYKHDPLPIVKFEKTAILSFPKYSVHKSLRGHYKHWGHVISLAQVSLALTYR